MDEFGIPDKNHTPGCEASSMVVRIDANMHRISGHNPITNDQPKPTFPISIAYPADVFDGHCF
ncbi:MAG: hypothetical protein ACKORJ_05140, partial [Bacteroidota bacterium]